MKAVSFIIAAAAASILSCGMMRAQDGVPYDEKFRYIEVTGTSEVEIIPDEIHFVIGIKEYFEEEFDGKSKPEDYRTKVRIEDIESQMREALHSIGITDNDIRTQDVGDYWRERGLDFIISVIDTKGVSSMRIGEMSNKDILKYHEQGKKDALLAARNKAEYMAEALGEEIGKVLSIEEHGGGTDHYTVVQNSKLRMDGAALGSAEAAPAASASDAFRTIKYTYSVTCRFALKGW